MSFWKKLFGGGGEAKAPAPAASQEHKGFTILATPIAEGGQFRVAGKIQKMGTDGTLREHAFQRADRMAEQDTAIEISFQKGRQIIDERGERLFDAP